LRSRTRRNSDCVGASAKLAAEHKPAPKIAVAIARELAGFLWAALQAAPAIVN